MDKSVQEQKVKNILNQLDNNELISRLKYLQTQNIELQRQLEEKDSKLQNQQQIIQNNNKQIQNQNLIMKEFQEQLILKDKQIQDLLLQLAQHPPSNNFGQFSAQNNNQLSNPYNLPSIQSPAQQQNKAERIPKLYMEKKIHEQYIRNLYNIEKRLLHQEYSNNSIEFVPQKKPQNSYEEYKQKLNQKPSIEKNRIKEQMNKEKITPLSISNKIQQQNIFENQSLVIGQNFGSLSNKRFEQIQQLQNQNQKQQLTNSALVQNSKINNENRYRDKEIENNYKSRNLSGLPSNEISSDFTIKKVHLENLRKVDSTEIEKRLQTRIDNEQQLQKELGQKDKKIKFIKMRRNQIRSREKNFSLNFSGLEDSILNYDARRDSHLDLYFKKKRLSRNGGSHNKLRSLSSHKLEKQFSSSYSKLQDFDSRMNKISSQILNQMPVANNPLLYQKQNQVNKKKRKKTQDGNFKVVKKLQEVNDDFFQSIIQEQMRDEGIFRIKQKPVVENQEDITHLNERLNMLKNFDNLFLQPKYLNKKNVKQRVTNKIINILPQIPARNKSYGVDSVNRYNPKNTYQVNKTEQRVNSRSISPQRTLNKQSNFELPYKSQSKDQQSLKYNLKSQKNTLGTSKSRYSNQKMRIPSNQNKIELLSGIKHLNRNLIDQRNHYYPNEVLDYNIGQYDFMPKRSSDLVAVQKYKQTIAQPIFVDPSLITQASNFKITKTYNNTTRNQTPEQIRFSSYLNSQFDGLNRKI